MKRTRLAGYVLVLLTVGWFMPPLRECIFSRMERLAFPWLFDD